MKCARKIFQAAIAALLVGAGISFNSWAFVQEGSVPGTVKSDQALLTEKAKEATKRYCL
jgi:hypothetical protein